MALDSYEALRASLVRWLKRNNLNDYVPDFIALAEVRLNRRLRVRQMRSETVMTPRKTEVALPTDYLEMIRVKYGGRRLDFFSEATVDSWGSPSICRGYCLAGDTIRLLARVDGESKLSMTYYQQIEALSDANPTNWLLEDAPDAYLYASLLEAEPYLKNDERIGIWREALTQAISDIGKSDGAAGHSGSTMVMRSE